MLILLYIGFDMKNKKILGHKEKISILDLDLYNLDAKVDTGADLSALHCDDIIIKENIVFFTLFNKIHPSYNNRRINMQIYKIKKIKSSNGQSESRPCIKVTLSCGNKKYKSIVSLTTRKNMKFPMLIGKAFLKNNFLVDVSKDYLVSDLVKKDIIC